VLLRDQFCRKVLSWELLGFYCEHHVLIARCLGTGSSSAPWAQI